MLSNLLLAHSIPACPPQASTIKPPHPSEYGTSLCCKCLAKLAIRAIVSSEIGSPPANWFALALPIGVPQSPQPFSSAHANAFLAAFLADSG